MQFYWAEPSPSCDLLTSLIVIIMIGIHSNIALNSFVNENIMEDVRS